MLNRTRKILLFCAIGVFMVALFTKLILPENTLSTRVPYYRKNIIPSTLVTV